MKFFSPNLGNISKKWLGIMGCGMVDPEVLNAVSIDPEVYTGNKLGMGIVRIATILQGVYDTCYYCQIDFRFLK